MQDRTKLYIDGEWGAAESGQEFDVFNPADGSVLGRASDAGVRQTTRAVDAAKRVAARGGHRRRLVVSGRDMAKGAQPDRSRQDGAGQRNQAHHRDDEPRHDFYSTHGILFNGWNPSTGSLTRTRPFPYRHSICQRRANCSVSHH